MGLGIIFVTVFIDYDMTAARKTDGSIIAVVLSKNAQDAGFAIKPEGRVIRAKLPASTI
ncbi:MAG: hypothetical protein GX193_04590 [Clostridiales bacterium]|nr:hypothetical protein [Clostridiales bacterium]